MHPPSSVLKLRLIYAQSLCAARITITSLVPRTLHRTGQEKTVSELNYAPHCREVWESGGIAPRILNLGNIWTWVVSYTPHTLYSWGRSPWNPPNRRPGGPQGTSGCCEEEPVSAWNRTRIPRLPSCLSGLKLTNFMELSPSSEAASCANTQKFPNVL
jgi:hypothetical protein